MKYCQLCGWIVDDDEIEVGQCCPDCCTGFIVLDTTDTPTTTTEP